MSWLYLGSVCSYRYRNPQNCAHTRALLPPPLKRANAISSNCREAASVCYLPRFKATIQYPPSVFIKALLTLTPEQPKTCFLARWAQRSGYAGSRAEGLGAAAAPRPPQPPEQSNFPARLRSLHPDLDRLGEKPQPKALRLSSAVGKKRKFFCPRKLAEGWGEAKGSARPYP